MFDFEGSFPFWCELLGFIVRFQVFVIEPDLISDFPRGKVGVYAVFHEKSGLFMGGDGFLLCFGKKVEAFF